MCTDLATRHPTRYAVTPHTVHPDIPERLRENSQLYKLKPN